MLDKIWSWFKYIFLWWKDAIVGFFTDDEPLDISDVEINTAEGTITQIGGTGMKKAFLVGINSYPDAPLRGCVNDVLLMYKLLSEKFGFNTKDMVLITDKDATKANILAGLKKLVMGAKAGDTLYFHFSGHGSQVVVNDWTNSNEADGRDEIICPVDLDWNNPLRDNDLGAIFKTVPSGVKVVVALDCCHSGTGLRDGCKKLGDRTDNDWTNRFMPPPPSNILTNPLINLDKDLNFTIPTADKDVQTQKRGCMVTAADQGNAILISGCRDNQTSADAWINGRYHGAMTYYLAETLSDKNFNVSYRDLVAELNTKLLNRRYTQSPQLECKQEFFDRKFLI
jgi:hypothetical protein